MTVSALPPFSPALKAALRDLRLGKELSPAALRDLIAKLSAAELRLLVIAGQLYLEGLKVKRSLN